MGSFAIGSFVYFVTTRGNVGRFVAKLNIIRDGRYFEIARYDSATADIQ